MDRRTAAAALVAYAVAATALFAPWAARDREVVEATPAHPPLYTRVPVEVPPRKTLCVRPVTLTDRTERVRFGIMDAPPREIRVTARGPGYRHTAGLTAAGPVVDAAVERPPRTIEGEVCFENPGEEPVALLGHSDPRIQSRADPWLEGVGRDDIEVSVTLLRRRPAGYASRAGDLLAHADALAAGFVGPWLIALVALAAALAIPAGLLAALAAASSRDRQK